MIFYFSGTGNSAWVATRLAELMDDTLVSITDVKNEHKAFYLKVNEPVGFVFPVHAWGPPKLLLDFIRLLQMDFPSYLYFVCTCGDDTGKTGAIFEKVVHERGWACSAGYSVTMPNTYVSLPGFDVDGEELEQRKVQNARSRVDFIAGEILTRTRQERYNCHEGVFPAFKSYVIRPLFYRFLMSPKLFYASDKCIGCGRCEKSCPIHNIWVGEKPEWGQTCVHCLACYHVCPLHAVEYGKRTKHKGQYKGIGRD